MPDSSSDVSAAPPPSPRPVRFWFRGAITAVDVADPTRSVLDWLREEQRAVGTKEGCNEGDCGACTVVVGALADGELALRAVNACIQFLPMLDGKALFTVEDLRALAGQPGGALHPVQQAMVDCHGSQCGFCTPGFVMSLWALYEGRQPTPTRQEIADALAGNLCRCTGYRPIIDAGVQMFAAPRVSLVRAPIVAALTTLRADPPLECGRPGARFVAPRSLAEFARLRAAQPDARIVAGATDVGLWVTKRLRALGDVLCLGALPELQRIEERAGALWLGAGVSLEAGYSALTARWPELREHWLRFAGPPVRHAGTLVGNLANGSPIGDSAPVLMALRAELELRCDEQVRRLPLDEFYVGYQRNRLAPGEFVQAVVVPPRGDETVRAYKVSKRFDSDISALSAGFALWLEGARVRDVRLAYGGMAAVVKRAAAAEAALRGQIWSEASLRAAQAALAQDFAPISDLRASADYRMQVAQNLLRRLWLATRAEAPLAADALSVWPVRAGAAGGEEGV